MLAVVQIRGKIGTKRDIRETMEMLRLSRVNHCILVEKDPVMEGMVKKVKDWVTWGEINDRVLKKLVAERGRTPGNKPVPKKDVDSVITKIKGKKESGIKPVFRLSPPRKGYKKVKHAFPKGSLGYRGDKINELLERMI